MVEKLEDILDETTHMIFENISVLHQQYFKIKTIEVGFLNQSSFKIEGVDYSDFLLGRKRLEVFCIFCFINFQNQLIEKK